MSARLRTSGPRRALYRVVKFDAQARRVWIVDQDGPVSVTNDADRVVDEVNELYAGCRIFYKDTIGNWDELVHEGGRFTGFAPARGMAP